MENEKIVELEHKINDLEARCRFYEGIIYKIESDEELSTGQFVTVVQILAKRNKIPRKESKK